MIDPRDFGRLEGKVDAIDQKIDRVLAAFADHDALDVTRFANMGTDIKKIQIGRAYANGRQHSITAIISVACSALIAIGARLIHS